VARSRKWLASNLGVDLARKEVIYSDLIRSVTLRDTSYWLQVIFSAGIATLGLVLNSPAVVIGAMLISPLMGPILANGLAFAVGDVILAIRALLNLALSCLAAISWVVLLVGFLPFKEITPEILARTRPNVLDLGVALFAGALAAVATSKEVKGVVTSIPGVAIAVALMPPLCVVGYGIGVALSLNGGDGLSVASGGGLLFLTNLTAIVFMAMIIFLLLHIDEPAVRDRVRQQHHQDPESCWIQSVLDRVPASKRFKAIGGLPSRFLIILVPVLILLFPLNRSFRQLSKEILQQQQTNRVTQAGKIIWQQNFATFPDGTLRSFINQISVQDQKGKLDLQLGVFTSQLYTPEEKAQYVQQLANRLGRSPDDLKLQLIEIPTASNERIAELFAEKTIPVPQPTETLPPTVAELQASLLQATESALTGFQLPPPAQLLQYEVTTRSVGPLSIDLRYLSPRKIGLDARNLLIQDIRNRVNLPTASVELDWISTSPGSIPFDLDKTELKAASQKVLDRLGQLLQDQPKLQLQLTVDRETLESKEIAQKRIQVVQNYLQSKWQIAKKRITSKVEKVLPQGRTPRMQLTLALWFPFLEGYTSGHFHSSTQTLVV
jgi:uncharacterized hydrophobic protein (TIGR00271 family)